MARMSVFRTLASVGSEMLKIRVATPVRNWPMIALARRSRSVRAVTDHIISPGPARCRKIGGHERGDTPEACGAGAELGAAGGGRRGRHTELHPAGGGPRRLAARPRRRGGRARPSPPARGSPDRLP